MRFFFSVNRRRRRGVHAKKRLHAGHHIREWFWPSMGWLGLARWMEIKMKRTPGSAHKLALGFALGAFVSFTPFIGLHILLGAFLAWIFKGSIWTSALGTIVGNPWTFPFIWAWIYKLGNFILHVEDPTKFSEVVHTVTSITLKTLWQNLTLYWESILWPMTVGGVPTGILVGLGFYWAIRFNIASWRAARALHMQHKRSARHKSRTTMKEKVISKIAPTKEEEQ
jgi:uncharacterized protein (DUF2062 family)